MYLISNKHKRETFSTHLHYFLQSRSFYFNLPSVFMMCGKKKKKEAQGTNSFDFLHATETA